MLTELRALPVSKSITLGTPMPTASAGPASSIASASCSTSASLSERTVGRRTGSESTPSSRTATETLVPPTSTPIKRSPTLCTLATLYGPPVADDHALVERLRAGDEEAFMDLVVRWSPAMMRVARMYVPTAAIAEDVVQETWLAALQGLDRFEERSSLRTWVFSILVNRARTRGQRERRSVPFASLAREETDGEFAAVDPDRFVGGGTGAGAWAAPPVRWWEEPERALASDEAVERIEAEIAKLPEMQRTVITMRDVEACPPRRCVALWTYPRPIRGSFCTARGRRCERASRSTTPMPDLLTRLFRRRGGDPGLSCQEMVELVTDYLEGALSPADRARFDAHISGCEGCTMYLRQMREMLELLGELTSDSISPQAEAELLAAFRDWKSDDGPSA